MSRAAAGLSTNADLLLRRPNEPRTDLEEQLSELQRQLRPERKFRPRPSHAILLAVVLLGGWLLLTFSRGMAQLNEAADQQAAVTSEIAALSDRLDAGRRELMLVQTDGFQALQARSFGMGTPGELVFSLNAGAPAAEPLTPLGGTAAQAQKTSALDAWLSLLFGR